MLTVVVCLIWLPLRELIEICNPATLRASNSVPKPGYGGRNGGIKSVTVIPNQQQQGKAREIKRLEEYLGRAGDSGERDLFRSHSEKQM